MKNVRFKDFLIDYLEANNITNKDFANRLGITPKHLIDILSGTTQLSSQLIDKISFITDIPADYIYRIESNYNLESRIDTFLIREELSETDYLNKFDYKYLIKDNYIDITDKNDKLEIIKDILKFLRVPSPEEIYKIDNNAYFKSKNDKPELLLLWLEKCYRETLKQEVSEYHKENIDVLVNYISKSAKDGKYFEEELINEFNKNGIFLVIQDDIPGSKIRGAFKVHRGIPAIYLTHKHKRITDIYFALLHELAHCKTDFNKAQATNLISYETCDDKEEEKRDNQAFNWAVDDNYYYNICCKKDYDIEEETKFPKCFVLYRLAKDGKIKYSDSKYQKYNFLLN